MAKVSINSNEISGIIASLNSSCNSLESEVSSKVKNTFQVLSDLGLVSNGITKIQQQAKSIVDVERSILSTISKHLGDVIDNEKNLNSGFNSGYSSNGSYSGGSVSTETGTSGSGSAEGSDIDVDQTDEGKKINVEGFSQLVNLLTDDEKKSLLELLKSKKDDETEYVDLLLDTSNSEELFKLLKSILTDVEFEDLSLEDTKEVQKILLNAVVNSNTEYVDLKDNSILVAKEYLLNISKEYQISVGDLVLDDRYANVLKTSLIKLYNGTVDSSITEIEIEKFREFVNLRAVKKGITSEELLENQMKELL